jgi:hypothetical protein
MIKKSLKILFVILTSCAIQFHAGCKLPDEPDYEPPPVTYSTGMWYVGQLGTGGDARFVKGYIINGTQYAFLADGQKGLEIINISNPKTPSLTSNYSTGGFVWEVIVDTISSNKYAFLSDEDKGLIILNVTSPSAPVPDTVFSYPGGVNSSCYKNGYLYAALRQGVVKIINASSLPDSVFEAGTYTPQNTVEHIEISGTTAYLLEGTSGVEIVSIANPLTPVFLSIYNTPGTCSDLKIGGDIAYIADGTSGVCAVNIGNPSRPELLSTENTESDVRGIDYSPNFMFTAEYNMGAEVFNLFSPPNPDALGYYEAPGYCYSVNYFKGKILIANGNYGLLILRF